MSSNPPLLGYESRDGGALEPGEELLWEGGGRKRHRPAFRITNRRAFFLLGKADAAKHRVTVQWPLREAIVVHLPSRRGATIQLGNLWLTDVEDWATVAGLLISVNRRRWVRRRRTSAKPESRMQAIPTTETAHAAQQVSYSSVTTELGLLENERVIWTGRPIISNRITWPVARGKLIVLAALCLPSAMIWKVASANQLEAVDVILGLIAAVWLPVAIHSLTTKPIFARRRLRRTVYVLTSRRAFIIEPAHGGRRIRFIFIDALLARFDRTIQNDGSGDLMVGQGISFSQIPEASTVHAQLVDAVLAARKDLPDLGWQDADS